MSLKNEFEFSSGGVIKKGLQLLLIKTPSECESTVWTFPKGKIEKGESPSAAALREVLEETGYRCRIEKQLGESRYFFRRGDTLVNKKVKWFLMLPVKKEGPPEMEIKKARWVKSKKAENILKYNSDIGLFKKVFPA